MSDLVFRTTSTDHTVLEAVIEAADTRPNPVWLVDGDVAAHRRRLASAIEQLGSGYRHAAARSVRALACGLARRHEILQDLLTRALKRGPGR